MQKALILGIDPGFTGALALYDSAAGAVIDVWDMPLKKEGGVLDKQRRQEPHSKPHQYRAEPQHRSEIDGTALASIIAAIASRTTLAVVERVHASPGAGVTSMFRFGEGYGMLLGILLANGIRTITPAPAVWKCSLGLTHDKKQSLDAVGTYVSAECKSQWIRLAKHHGRAEAILLAYYGAKAINKNCTAF